MCDDYFEDDFSDEFDDGDFMDNEPCDEGIPGDEPLQDDNLIEAQSDEPCGPDWEDIAFLGAMSEEIAEERRRRRQIKREIEDDNEKSDNFDYLF